jgi:hypothetical protein
MKAKIVVEKVLARGEKRYKISKFDGIANIAHLPNRYVDSENAYSLSVVQTPAVYCHLDHSIFLRVPDGETRFRIAKKILEVVA